MDQDVIKLHAALPEGSGLLVDFSFKKLNAVRLAGKLINENGYYSTDETLLFAGPGEACSCPRSLHRLSFYCRLWSRCPHRNLKKRPLSPGRTILMKGIGASKFYPKKGHIVLIPGLYLSFYYREELLILVFCALIDRGFFYLPDYEDAIIIHVIAEDADHLTDCPHLDPR